MVIIYMVIAINCVLLVLQGLGLQLVLDRYCGSMIADLYPHPLIPVPLTSASLADPRLSLVVAIVQVGECISNPSVITICINLISGDSIHSKRARSIVNTTVIDPFIDGQAFRRC